MNHIQKCPYCFKEMRAGNKYLGFGLNRIIYWCECGAVANIMKDSKDRKIAGFKIADIEYKE